MAQNRTFKFYGIGYGSSPVSVTATIGGSVVFSGTIPTINEPIDPYPSPTPEVAYTTEIFSIDNSSDLNTDFAGFVPMTLTVNNGRGVLISTISSNWVFLPHTDVTGNVINDPGSSTNFVSCYSGYPSNSEGTPDPRSSVSINDQQQVPPEPVSTGCWVWRVLVDQTISFNWNICLGAVGETPGNTANYSGPYTPVPNYPPPLVDQ